MAYCTVCGQNKKLKSAVCDVCISGEARPSNSDPKEHTDFVTTHQLPLMGHRFNGRLGVLRHSLYRFCRVSQPIDLIREPENPRDKNAVVAIAELPNGKIFDLGYLPRHAAPKFAEAILQGRLLSAKIIDFTPSSEDDPEENVILIEIAIRNASQTTADASKQQSYSPEVSPMPPSLPQSSAYVCATALSSRPKPLTSTDGSIKENSAPEFRTPKSKANRTTGVRGGIWYFFVSHAVLAPMYFFGTNDLGSRITFAQWVGILEAIINIVIGALLWSRAAILLPALKIYFLTYFSLLGLLAVFIYFMLGSDKVIGSLVASLIYQGLWYLYFRRSKRVLKTYGANI